ncbi:MAG TPA: hypothetical protein PKD78_15455, partial [Saprospiraceae bacterium]|nr:hypothetical protein [Saprospiraceae bacterium]
VLEVQYLDANGKVVCVDRLTLECDFCISIQEEDFVCDPAGQQVTMSFCVSIPLSNMFSANSLVLTGPTGVVFSPAAFPLPNVPPGGTYCSLSTTISVPSGTLPDSLCIMFTAHQKDVTAGFPPGECCMIKECYDLPDCCPNFATATPVDSTDGRCCWKITLNQPPATSQFVTLNVIPVPGSPVTVQAIAADPNWYFNMAPGQQSVSFAPVPLAPLPALSTLPSICFQVPSGSPVPQLLEVVWSGAQQNVLCRDTLEFFCKPDTDCVAVTPSSLLCDPNVQGQSVYTLAITHPFGSTLTVTPTHVAVVDVSPAGAVVGTGIYPLGSFSPGSTALVPITLQGTPGTQVCFALNLYSNPSPNIFLDCCVTKDTFCVVLPNCYLIPGAQPISMYPNPADQAFTLDFGGTGSPARGRVRIRDMA